MVLLEKYKMERKIGKLVILRHICDSKDTLFGPFCPSRTMKMKAKIWNEILKKAKSLGLVAPCRDYKYLRDIFWQNIKRMSVAKRESGKPFQSTPIDEIVFEIIDNTSTLHTHKKNEANKTEVEHATNEDLKMNFEIVNDVDITIEEVDYLKEEPPFMEDSEQSETQDAETEACRVSNPTQKKLDKVEEPWSDDEKDLTDRITMRKEETKMKRKKIQLEIDFLELQNYKTQLEVLDLETKLGVGPSKFTREIAKRRKIKNIGFEYEDDEDSDSC